MENANKKDDFKSLFQDKKSQNFTVWVVGITISLLILFILVNQLLKIEQFGQLGDFFNGIAAPVLSLITIILLYNSFLVQKEELKATRQALEQSTQEMKNSAAIMERTEQNAKLERLESIVFKLLEICDNKRQNIQLSDTISSFDVLYGKRNDTLHYVGSEATKYWFMKVIREQKVENNAKKIPELIASNFESLKNIDDEFFKSLRSFAYSFVAIYKCILHSKISADQLDYLRFAINNYVTREEMFLVKLFINQVDDLSNLRTELEPFGITSTSEAIYEQHIKDEINKSPYD